MTKLIKPLHPGTQEAIKEGCTCEIVDGHVIINKKCPIHNPQTTKAKKDKAIG